MAVVAVNVAGKRLIVEPFGDLIMGMYESGPSMYDVATLVGQWFNQHKSPGSWASAFLFGWVNRGFQLN